MPPTSRHGSSPGEATAHNASGKLAPHRMAGGRMAHRHRTMSSLKMCQGLMVSSGLMGQYGSESTIMYALHAIPSVSSTWHQPSASRAPAAPHTARTSHDPQPLPSASPIRNTARMMENTYTVEPSIIPINRVQTTSAPNAH